jgi:hypothetical protein
MHSHDAHARNLAVAASHRDIGAGPRLYPYLISSVAFSVSEEPLSSMGHECGRKHSAYAQLPSTCYDVVSLFSGKGDG